MLIILLTTLIAFTGSIVSVYALNRHQRLYYKGISSRFQGEHEIAIKYYTRAIKLKPKFADAHYSKGNAQFELGNYSAALDNYSQAIEFKPNFIEAYYNRGNTHAVLGNWKEALADFTQTIRLDSKHAKAYGNRGYIYTKLDNQRDAERDLQHAIKLFLERGDLENYQLAMKHLGSEVAIAPQEIHSQPEKNSAELVEVGVR